MSSDNQVRVDIVGNASGLKQATQEARRELDDLKNVANNTDQRIREAGVGTGVFRDGLSGVKDAAASAAAEITGFSEDSVLMAARLGGVAITVSAVAVAMFKAFHDGQREVEAMNLAIDRTNGYSGATRDSLRSLAQEMSSYGTMTVGQAKEIATALAASGSIGAAAFNRIALMAENFARVTQEDVAKITPQLVRLFADPTRGAEELNRTMHFLSAAEIDRIERLQKTGDLSGAQLALEEKLAERLEQIAPKLGTLERAWVAVTGAASKAWDAMMGMGRDKSTKERLDEARKNVAYLESDAAKNMVSTKRAEQLFSARRDVMKLEEQLDQEQQDAFNRSQAAEHNRQESEARDIVKRYSISAKAAEIDAQITLLERLRLTASREQAQEYDKTIKELRDKKGKLFAEKISEFDNIRKSLIGKIAAQEADLNSVEKLTSAEVEYAQYQAQISAGTIKLTATEKAEAEVLWQRYIKAAKNVEIDKEQAKLYADLEKEAAKRIEAAEKETKSLEDQVKKQQDENAAIGLTQQQLAALNDERMAAAIAAKEQAYETALLLEPYAAETLELGKQIEALKQLRELRADGAVRQAAATQAQEVAQEFARTYEGIESGISESIIRGGKNGAQSLKDTLLRTFEAMATQLILRPIIQPVYATAASMMGVDMTKAGGSWASGGSNILNMASNANSLWNATSTGSSYYNFATSSVGEALGLGTSALSASWTAAAPAAAAGLNTLTGVSALNSLSGVSGLSAMTGASTATTAAGGLSAVGSALPYVGLALAAASLLGGAFSDKELPPEYRFRQWSKGSDAERDTRFDAGRGWMREDVFGRMSVFAQHVGGDEGGKSAKLAQQYLDPLVAIDNAIAGYLDKSKIKEISKNLDGFYSGELASPKGLDGQFATRLGVMTDAIGGAVDELTDKLTGTFAEKSALVLTLLAKQGDDAYTSLARSLADAEGATAKSVSTLLTNLSSVNDIFKRLGYSLDEITAGGASAASALVDLYGGLDKLSTATSAYYSAFYSQQEQASNAMQEVSDQLAKIGLSMPGSKDGYRAMVDAAAAAGTAGQEMWKKLVDLSPSVAAAFDAQSQALQAASSSVSTAQSNLRSAYEQQARDTQTLVDNLAASLTKLQEYQSSLLLGDLSPLSAAEKTAQATAQWGDIKTRAKLGDLSAIDSLQTVGDAYLTQIKATSVSREDYLLKAADVLDTIGTVEGVVTRQKTIAEQQLDQMKSQVSQLVDINSNTSTIAQAIAALAAAQAGLAGLSGNTSALNTTAVGSVTSVLEQDKAKQAVAAIDLYAQAMDAATLAASKSVVDGIAGINKTQISGMSDATIRAIASAAGATDTKLSGKGVSAAQVAAAIATAAPGADVSGLSKAKLLNIAEALGVKKFDVGTNSVPNDMLAMIHADERIMPAADNSALMRRLDEGTAFGAAMSAMARELAALRAEVAKLRATNERTEKHAEKTASATNTQAMIAKYGKAA